MSTVVFTRPPRPQGPPMPDGELALEPPPDLPVPVPRSVAQILMMLPMIAGVAAMMVLYSGRNRGVLTLVVGGLFGLSMVGMFMGSFMGGGSGEKKAEQTAQRRDYMRYLAQARRRIRRAAAQQRKSIQWRHPAPAALWTMVNSSRLWERRHTDADFVELRLAMGTQRMAVGISTPETKPVEDLEPMSALALRRFVRAHSTLPNMPMALQLRAFRRIALRGEQEHADDLMRAMICQAATFHSPEDLRIAVVAAPERMARWDWLKWLPHAQLDGLPDAAGPRRLIVDTMSELEALLADELSDRARGGVDQGSFAETPHVIVLLDGGDVDADCDLAGPGLAGVTVFDLSGMVPRHAGNWLLRLDVTESTLDMFLRGRRTPLGRPDTFSEVQAAAIARRLSRFRPSAVTSASEPLAVSAELPELLGVGDVGVLDPRVIWRPNRPTADRLSIPLGLDPQGAKIFLDLKEAAQGGMGPHGLIIGATGSGKSELLRTIVSALAITHSSEELNFVLVDFKGGATFATLDRLPHTSAVITNLEDELPLVDRMADAISGEMTRRQELLRAAGNYVSQRDYEKARRAGADLAPLPSLLIVCDEFSELLSAKPEFIELFVMIGRLGRSLGVHLLLASQRLEEGRLRGLDSHLSYRIGLRTFSAMESRVVLGVADAYELPQAPGHGYLKIDTQTMLRFRSAYVSGLYRGVRTGSGGTGAGGERMVPFRPGHMPLPEAPELIEAVDDDEPDNPDDIVKNSMLAVITNRIAGQGPPAHQVWLPPLSESPALSDLYPDLRVDPARGLSPAGWAGQGALAVPLGIVDRPFEQRRDLLMIELAGAGGNLAVVGGTQSGKSTLLRTMVCSLALTHTPQQVQFYCIDLGGGTMRGLEALPHVGGVAGRRDVNKMRRTVAEMSSLLDEREGLFAEHGIDSMAAYRRRKAAGEFTEDPFGDAFLIIDGWTTVRSDFEELIDDVTAIAQRGLGYGVHLVLATNRWTDMRPALRDLLGTKLELRLGDPSESEIDRRSAWNVPERASGRGLTPDKMQMLTALPRVDSRSSNEDLADGVQDLVTRVTKAWTGAPAPAVRLLPARFSVADIAPDPSTAMIPFAINESHLAPVTLDFANEPHFLAFGDGESGKTNLLRTIAKQLVTRYGPRDVRLLVVDYRRSLLGEIDEDRLTGYVASASTADELLGGVYGAFKQRLPGPDVTPEQLRARSWWTGPEMFVLVDDYDLVAGGSPNPVHRLLELLPQARDVGLHLVLARRSGGAGRALYDPVIQRLREIQTPGLIMSGSRDEGALLGNVRPAQQPPGRGVLVSRRGTGLVQIAWTPPRHES
ncbi:type VII secretion protein EccCa [Phytomonospora endophytica]|uniref:S-DNA-T family DNA segregation ATPase FtsK/SpoIIIE n=1 Tax=Phytomonospora endophytica TaxID=714109 RepID=A0A841FIB0_9ACTN|nr:type VII secretion protein EccCa [Phytomonospora endophytica]MBB6032867.1 S-DNA-T family DNA segregation ATPase FtsK/SpoIIIE [Phytomonospora endophytica]